MQITLLWDCGECGRERELRFDTSNFQVVLDAENRELALEDGQVVNLPLVQGEVVSGSEPIQLWCASCGHVSGELGMGYSFQPEHVPGG